MKLDLDMFDRGVNTYDNELSTKFTLAKNAAEKSI
jgi:hypothetical protein